MIHYMSLKNEPFELIKSGQKTIELRLYDEKRKNIKINDIIEFQHLENPNLKIKTKVIDLHIFKNFKEFYQNIDLTKCGYNEHTINTASHQDMNLYYSDEEQSKHKVIGIEIQLT